MAPEVGFEPTTKRLTAARSTTELLGSMTVTVFFIMLSPACLRQVPPLLVLLGFSRSLSESLRALRGNPFSS